MLKLLVYVKLRLWTLIVCFDVVIVELCYLLCVVIKSWFDWESFYLWMVDLISLINVRFMFNGIRKDIEMEWVSKWWRDALKHLVAC